MYQAIAEFTLAGALILIGLLTLAKASEPREVPFALLPLLFGLHEFSQGFIWLGLAHLIPPRATEMAVSYYVFYAKGFLQFWVPLSIWLLESPGWRKNILGALTLLGAGLTLYSLWGLSIAPVEVYLRNGLIVYHTPGTNSFWLGTAYVLTTCGALILSSGIAIQLYGWLNFIGLSLIYLLWPYAFSMVWCLYAALLSGVLYFYFIERRIAFLRRLRSREDAFSRKLSYELERLQKRYPKWRKRLEKLGRKAPV